MNAFFIVVVLKSEECAERGFLSEHILQLRTKKLSGFINYFQRFICYIQVRGFTFVLTSITVQQIKRTVQSVCQRLVNTDIKLLVIWTDS